MFLRTAMLGVRPRSTRPGRDEATVAGELSRLEPEGSPMIGLEGSYRQTENQHGRSLPCEESAAASASDQTRDRSASVLVVNPDQRSHRGPIEQPLRL